MKIADISIKRPVFITVIMIAITILGFVSLSKLALNDMPNADMPYVSVVVLEPGASPDEVETKVTKKIEEAVGEISGIETISSTASQGTSQTIVAFNLGMDSEAAAQSVRDKIAGIRGELPTDIYDPVISKFDMSSAPILSIAVYGLEDNQQLSDITENTIKRKLYAIPGIGSVDISGKDTREIHIKLDNNKLQQYNLTAGEILNSISSDNVDRSTGMVTDGEKEISITTDSRIKSIKDFENILVATRNNTEIRLSDVAEVEDGFEEKSSIAYYKGNPAIGIEIVKQSDANTVTVAKEVRKTLEELKTSLPEGVHADIVSDNSTSIEDSVNDVMKTIVEGCILAVIVVFLFLNEWESTLISATSLPISIISTFICIKLMNFSLNTMSLMALSLAVGLLIDDAIVVIENTVRHMHMGKTPLQAAKDAASEIGFAVIATTSAVISVFLPVAMVEGILGKYFIEFALTVVFSMAVSLIVSFTLVPMMASKLLKPGKKVGKTFVGRFFNWFNVKFDLVAEKYSDLVIVALNKRKLVLGVSAALFVGSLLLATTLGFSAIPATDKGQLTVSAQFDSGLTLDAASDKTKQLEGVIKKYPEVKLMYSSVKKSSASIKVELVDKKQRKESSREIAARLGDDLKGISGAQVTVAAASVASESGSKDVSYVLVGTDRTKVQAYAKELESKLKKDPNARDVSTNDKSGTPEVKVVVDRDKAADLGVNSSTAASALSTLFGGTTAGKYSNGSDRYDVKVELQDDQRQNLDNLDEIYISGSNNKLVQLSQITKKVIETGSASLHRYDKQPSIEVSCNVTGISSGTFQNKYMKTIQGELPEGVTVSIGGINGMLQDGINSLIVAIFMSIVFLYLVMAAQFESFIDPISIMFSLPLAIIGAILGTLAFGSSMSMVSLIGIILLMGLVSKNGILLIDSAKVRIRKGVPVKEALREAGLVRLRPIVMTTLAMIFGMIPLAIASGAGTEMRAPMAQAVIGGLITSTILTLFVVPIVYTILDDLKKRFKGISFKLPKLKLKLKEDKSA